MILGNFALLHALSCCWDLIGTLLRNEVSMSWASYCYAPLKAQYLSLQYKSFRGSNLLCLEVEHIRMGINAGHRERCPSRSKSQVTIFSK